jgi:hypothetical protein
MKVSPSVPGLEKTSCPQSRSVFWPAAAWAAEDVGAAEALEVAADAALTDAATDDVVAALAVLVAAAALDVGAWDAVALTVALVVVAALPLLAAVLTVAATLPPQAARSGTTAQAGANPARNRRRVSDMV